ncbi:hypothetical protein LTR08_003480 [Meristemomyces frigidus]|nr:hypothetical protein LTR08_003480 [Meristemomyces frigidus]
MASKTSLMGLPVELQALIVEHLSSKKDLKAVCLTCKELKAVAVPVLYHTVVFVINGNVTIDDDVNLFLAANHDELRYVRTLVIDDTEQEYDSGDGSALCRLLEVLPADCLETFQ